MRTLLPFVVMLVGGCDSVPTGSVDPCPEGSVLSEAVLPCDCQGAIVEELACGELVCDAAGLATVGDDTGGCSSDGSR